MTPPFSNSFQPPSPADHRENATTPGHPRGTLASLLRPLRTTLEADGSNWALTIAPMRPVDALTPWLNLGATLGAHTLLLDPRSTEANALVLDDESLAGVLARPALEYRHLIRIDGPVEASDVSAIARGLMAGRSALQSELRAMATMRVEGDRCLHIETRDQDAACGFVAESFRQYVAALRNRPARMITAPEPWQIMQLLEIKGGLSVRPLETQLYATFIDIGICAGADEPTRPAAHSLIYDVYGNSWHGEE
jgi:hypothetical protein